MDREDQVVWYLPTDSFYFMIQISDNHQEIREWLSEMTTGTVVVSGCGKIPRSGDHPSHCVYEHIQRNQFKIYFQHEQDAVAFKLAWGGECKLV